MRYFDLHCDTLYRAVTENKTLDTDELHISVSKAQGRFEKWKQFMTIWIPDELSYTQSMKLFLSASELLRSESEKFGIPIITNGDTEDMSGFFFAVENGAVIGDDIANIDLLFRHGVRMVTLTWNDENQLGTGADRQDAGLKKFGAQCVCEFENKGIIIDLSHASDRLFYDVASITTKPFCASHSDSRAICNHKRNLTDEQFKIIRDRGGIVGINFYKNFLSHDPEKASVTDVLRHTEHFLSLDGENTVSIGSDFDGCDVPDDLCGIEKIEFLYESYLKIGYNEQLVQKIMYDNAHNFLSKF